MQDLYARLAGELFHLPDEELDARHHREAKRLLDLVTRGEATLTEAESAIVSAYVAKMRDEMWP